MSQHVMGWKMSSKRTGHISSVDPDISGHEATIVRKVNCDVNECNKVDGNDENKHNEAARRLLIDNAKKNTKTGVKDTEVVITREKENGSDKSQTKIDSEAAKPRAPKLLSSQCPSRGFPVTWRLPDVLHQAVFL